MSSTSQRHILSALVFLAVSLLNLTTVLGAEPNPRVKFAPVPPVTVAAGDTATITLTCTIDKDWWIYSNRETLGPDGLGPMNTIVEITSPKLKILRVSMGTIKKVYDSTYLTTVEKIYKKGTIKVLVQVPADMPVGQHTVKFNLMIQRCNEGTCINRPDFFPQVTLTVTEATAKKVAIDSTSTAAAGPNNSQKAAPASRPKANARESADSDIEKAKKEGLLAFCLLAFGGGLLALLTPCVYPMIPITVSFFTKRSEKNKAGQMLDAIVFASGIVLTFTLIGIIVSIIFGASGLTNFAANPWTNLVIGALFIVLAFNLFGAFEIQVPVSVMNLLNKKSQGSGYTATLLMGVTFAVISFTCTGALVASLLADAGNGEYFYPTIGMLAFSLSFAAPFFILALAPSLVTKLPKSGGWMNNVKVVLGFLEIAFAMKFLSSADLVFSWGILPRDVILAIWIGIAFLIVLYLLGTYRMQLDSALESVSGLRIAYAITFASLGFWLFTGFGNRPLGEIDGVLPPLNYAEVISNGRNETSSTEPTSGGATSVSASHGNNTTTERWFDNLDAAKAEAKKTGKPIFIDFTGFTCTNCRWMEQNMFPRNSVATRMRKYVLVRLYTDKRTEPFISNQRLQETVYGSLTLPLYVLLAPDGEYIAKADYTRDEGKFTRFLDKAAPVPLSN